MIEKVEQMEAPDGSMLITQALVEEAAGYLHENFGRIWPVLYPSIKQCAAGMVLIRAMGYQQRDAPRELFRLRGNPFFVTVCDALVHGYQVARDMELYK